MRVAVSRTILDNSFCKMICKLIRYKPYIGVELVEEGSFYRDLAGALGNRVHKRREREKRRPLIR